VATFAVLGATSWGLTLTWLLSQNGHRVVVLTRTEDEAARVTAARGIARLPELELPATVAASAVTASDPRDFDGLVVVVPAQHVARSLPPGAGWRDVPVLSAAKGIEVATGRRMSEVLAASGWAAERIAALSGPNLAHEVLRGDPAAAVAASTDEARAAQWQTALSGPRFRVYSSTDIVGVELAGATKNIIAIAAGVAAGLGFGANTIAALVTRGLAEMTRLGVAWGADFATYLGLAGVGDLTATCFSPLSRNRRLGELLAAGLTPAEAVARIGEVVEGATTAPVVLGLADARGVDVPITQEVVAVLRGEIMVKDAIDDLLSRGLKRETNQRQ